MPSEMFVTFVQRTHVDLRENEIKIKKFSVIYWVFVRQSNACSRMFAVDLPYIYVKEVAYGVRRYD
jgi:hypothetical protein